MSQSEVILEYLKSGKSITPMEALKIANCFRLSGRIYDLIKKGYNIESKIVHRSGKYFSEYTLINQRQMEFA